MRRGQAAMEFLATYGWVLLVVLIAIGALAYFGVIDPGKWLPNTFTMSDGFSAGEFKVDAGGMTMGVYNNMGYDLKVVGYKITPVEGTADCASEEIFAEVINFGNGNDHLFSFPCSNVVEGQKVKGTIEFYYQRTGESVVHTANGDFSSVVEEGGTPPCIPDCSGNTCGSDGCTGTCTCDAGYECNGGSCEAICVPDCSGRICGDDGCGGICGRCPRSRPYCCGGRSCSMFRCAV